MSVYSGAIWGADGSSRGSTRPPIYAAQWVFERITIRAAGEHFTRSQLPLVQAAGFQVVETERLKAGTVQRIHAVKPA